MAAEIIPLPGTRGLTSPIAHYIRVGERGHLQLEELHARGRFHASRVVIDASWARYQRKFIAALYSDGIELVLDTKSAELSEPAKRNGFARHTPWAPEEDTRPLGGQYFQSGRHDIVPQIARFAVENNFSAVLAPCHFLRQGANDPWFDIDLRACERLRKALDESGGEKIAVDYSLIISHTLLRDEASRGALIGQLASIPFENLWIRASGFGSDGTAPGARSYINSLSALHNLGRPIISDYLGGLIGLGSVAFGAASGIAHGVGERERFDAGNWHEPPPDKKEDEEKKGGGRTNRVYIASIDRSLTVSELKALARARGGRRLLVCSERECCSGLEDMINNWRAHFLKQRSNQIRRIEEVPDLRREDDFLSKELALADQQSRQIGELNPVESELRPMGKETLAEAKLRLLARLKKHAKRDGKLRATLENLHETRGQNVPRARPTRHRVGKTSKIANSR
jgi:hypothetical protein